MLSKRPVIPEAMQHAIQYIYRVHHSILHPLVDHAKAFNDFINISEAYFWFQETEREKDQPSPGRYVESPPSLPYVFLPTGPYHT